jgi:hypothetical protein
VARRETLFDIFDAFLAAKNCYDTERDQHLKAEVPGM